MKVEFPGLFDLQVNGFGGVDFNDPAFTIDDFDRAAGAMRKTGVTRFLPTVITASPERFNACARTLATASKHAAMAGIHMEGPYISPEDGPRGAHPRAHVVPASIDDFRRRQEAAGGHVVLLTLAPEVPGALPLTEYLVAQGVRVAIGHSAATPEQVRAAISAGATMSTHLGNGLGRDVGPRKPSLFWEQLAADELCAGFIVDGHHLLPTTVKVMIRTKGLARSILVTDAIAAAGCPPGNYRLGEAGVVLDATGKVTKAGSTTALAGSSLSLHDAVANTVKFTSLPLSEVLPMASTLPAKYVGQSTVGRVEADWDEGRLGLTILRVAA